MSEITAEVFSCQQSVGAYSGITRVARTTHPIQHVKHWTDVLTKQFGSVISVISLRRLARWNFDFSDHYAHTRVSYSPCSPCLWQRRLWSCRWRSRPAPSLSHRHPCPPALRRRQRGTSCSWGLTVSAPRTTSAGPQALASPTYSSRRRPPCSARTGASHHPLLQPQPHHQPA